MPRIRFALGCHPHNAKDFTPEVEAALRDQLHDARIGALGEIGLDYHYDLSPRDDQRRVFRAQIRLAKEAGLPIMLHIREAYDEALDILRDEGFPEAGTILHCFTGDAATLAPWLAEGVYVSIGGAVTFNNSDALREAVSNIPLDRLLSETDAPYMAPKPLRGQECESAQIVFTVAKLAELYGIQPGRTRGTFVLQLMKNAHAILSQDPTAWQLQTERGRESMAYYSAPPGMTRAKFIDGILSSSN